jgi:hypothetical protein
LAHGLAAQSLNDLLHRTVFQSYGAMKSNFLRLSVACFLTLLSRSIFQSSVDNYFSLIRKPSSSIGQKNSTIAAVARVPGIPDFDWPSLFKCAPLHRSLCRSYRPTF